MRQCYRIFMITRSFHLEVFFNILLNLCKRTVCMHCCFLWFIQSFVWILKSRINLIRLNPFCVLFPYMYAFFVFFIPFSVVLMYKGLGCIDYLTFIIIFLWKWVLYVSYLCFVNSSFIIFLPHACWSQTYIGCDSCVNFICTPWSFRVIFMNIWRKKVPLNQQQLSDLQWILPGLSYCRNIIYLLQFFFHPNGF